MADTREKMTEREARKWVRQHWATFMLMADCPDKAPNEAANVFGEESRRLAGRLGLWRDFEPLEPRHG